MGFLVKLFYIFEKSCSIHKSPKKLKIIETKLIV